MDIKWWTNDIKNGTYKTENNLRTKKRGLEDVPNAIECNMFTVMKNHVNGYFTDNAYEGVQGLEFDYVILPETSHEFVPNKRDLEVIINCLK